jgi:hypothetical protein
MSDSIIVLKVCQSGTCMYEPFAYCDSESAATQLTEQYKHTHAYLYTNRVPGHNEAVGDIIRLTVPLNTEITDRRLT